MLWKKTGWFWRIGLTTISAVLVLSISGCGETLPEEALFDKSERESQHLPQDVGVETEKIVDICLELYEKAAEENKIADLETIRSIVNHLGENGYAAIDSKNQIDMTANEQVVQFCEQANSQKEAAVTIIEVSWSGGFTKYDLKADNGNIEVTQEHYQYEAGQLKNMGTERYNVDSWNYTEEGYLLFSGTWFSEELYVLTLSGAEEYKAFRIQPLDAKCRELNRRYLLPIGYERNNMFLIDWSEKDFGELNFYDLYDIFYPKINGWEFPYEMDSNLSAREVYKIPKDAFEGVIMTYFNIDSGILQSKTTYDADTAAYEYSPRGFEEVEYPEYPYPETVDYTKNSDGTVTLTVNVVFPYKGDSKVYAHEVVVRPLEDGGIQYVSNKIIPSEGNSEETWHTPRLTMEERKAADEVWETPVEIEDSKGYNLPIDEGEREKAEDDCKKMMGLILDIYERADKGSASNVVLNDETVFKMQKKVSESGYPVTTMIIYGNMENHEKMDHFLKECMEGKSGTEIIYTIHSGGGIGRTKYIFDGADMYALSANAIWRKDDTAKMSYVSYTRIKEWNYSAKGWFCYELCVPEYPEVTEMVDGSCLLRIKPMKEELREMSEKCVEGLAYQGNNLLCSNWDAEQMEKLDLNGMYEYLYKMKYQKRFSPEGYPKGIPKDEFENLIMEYLPISAEQIQKYAVFDEESQTYVWEHLGCFNYTPNFFGTSLPEVTDIKENDDGTLTLTVDAVCDMVVCDDAVITHELTVRFAEDGSFQYLGNKILDNGIENIPDYQYRINMQREN